MTDQPRPVRIQRQRTKGWKMPEGAVYVGKPTKWGNPFTVEGYYRAGYSGNGFDAIRICVMVFRAWLCGDIVERYLLCYIEQMAPRRNPPTDLSVLRGKDLACWCPLDQPCHADVLLELANAD